MPRCPNGTRRNKQTGECEPKSQTTKVCPPGKLLNPKTNRCINDTVANRKKIGLTKKKANKVCPPGKLLNPKTNRCIQDTTANRKKLSLVPIKTQPFLSSSICTKSKQKRPVDLQKITYKYIWGKTIGPDDPFFKMYTFSYEKNPLTEIKFLNRGGYGSVYRLSNAKHQIALKTYNNHKDDELKVLRLLNKKKIPCSVINSRLLKLQDKQYVTLMDIMEGSLDKAKLTSKNRVPVWKRVCEHLQCLNEHKLCYTDLKMLNILFRCTGNRTMEVVLGDVGGICEQKHAEQNASTYPPWEWRGTRGFPLCYESTIVWQTGVLLLEMLNIDIEFLYYKNIIQFRMIPFQEKLQKVLDDPRVLRLKYKEKPIQPLLRDIFSLDWKHRIKMKDILNYLR